MVLHILCLVWVPFSCTYIKPILGWLVFSQPTAAKHLSWWLTPSAIVMLFGKVKHSCCIWALRDKFCLANGSQPQVARMECIFLCVQMQCEVWALKNLIPVSENLKKTGLVTSWYVSNPCSEGFQTEKLSTKVRLPFLNFSHSDYVWLQHLHLHYALFHTYDMQPIRVLLHVNSWGKREQCAPNFYCQEAAGYAGCKALLNTLIWKIKQLQWPEAIYPSRDFQSYTYLAFCFLGTFLGLPKMFPAYIYNISKALFTFPHIIIAIVPHLY